MQCIAHSGECFCVDKFGRKNIKNNLLKENILNCSIIREKEEEINKENNNKLISNTKIALNKDKEIINNNNCTDPLREFRLFFFFNFKIKKYLKIIVEVFALFLVFQEIIYLNVHNKNK